MKKTLLFLSVLALAHVLTAGAFIVTPSATMRYTAGTSLQVNWIFDVPPAPGTKYSAWLSLDTATVQIGNNIPAENGTLEWTIPRTVFGAKCRVSLVRQGTAEVAAVSPGHFYIIPPTRITILSPNGGERFTRPSTYQIRWQARDIVAEHGQTVMFQLGYYPGGCRSGEPTILIWTPDPGPAIGSGATGYRFVIPSSAPLGSNFFIRALIQSSAYKARGFNKAGTDDSDNCFTVTR